MTLLRIMTLNILTDGLYNYGDSRFTLRAEALKEMIHAENPDLIGVQELTEKMKPRLSSVFETYEITGDSRGSLLTDEYSSILFKKDRFELLDSGTFWLSDQPHKRGSKHLFSQFPRIVTFVHLKDNESGTDFSMYNTHLDHNFPPVRTKQAGILYSIILDTHEGQFTAVTGDFNAVPGSLALQEACGSELYDLCDDSLGSTLKGKIGSAIQHNKPIDHILLSRHIKAKSLKKLDGKYAGIYPSDHYPLIAEIEY